jgi:hypothetical protein
MASKVDFDRKDLKGPDAFFETVGVANRYFQNNRTAVIAGVAAIIALFIAVLGIQRWRQSRAEETASTFLRGADALDANNVSSARAALDNVAATAGGIYGELAHLYEADIAMREQRWDDALKGYDEVSGVGSAPYIRQIAQLGKGHALEAKGDAAAALTAYVAASDAEGPFKENALHDRLRVARATANTAEVTATIKKILEAYPETQDADELAAELPSGEQPAAKDAGAKQDE